MRLILKQRSLRYLGSSIIACFDLNLVWFHLYSDFVIFGRPVNTSAMYTIFRRLIYVITTDIKGHRKSIIIVKCYESKAYNLDEDI